MTQHLRTIGLLASSAVVLGACATKGFVRTSIANERVAREVADSTIRAEHRADIAAARSDVAALRSDVTSLRSDVQGLRTDLGALRTDFGARITAMEEGLRFAFPVTFAYNDATVRETDRPALDRFAQVVQKYYPESKITVEGFADAAGSRGYNQRLSKRRAEAVVQYLVGKGMAATQLAPVGYGESRQVHPGARKDQPGAEENRRVVFVIETRGTAASGPVARGAPR